MAGRRPAGLGVLEGGLAFPHLNDGARLEIAPPDRLLVEGSPPESALLGRRPRRRAQAAPAVTRETDRVGGIERAIPQLARHLLVTLVEPLAVVRELAASHPVAVP